MSETSAEKENLAETINPKPLDLSHNYCGTGSMPVQDRLFKRCLLTDKGLNEMGVEGLEPTRPFRVNGF